MSGFFEGCPEGLPFFDQKKFKNGLDKSDNYLYIVYNEHNDTNELITNLRVPMQNTPQKHAEFKQTMMPYSDMLYSYGYYLTNDKDDANDLLQDTYMKAFRFYDRFEQGTNAKAWLYRIMRNTYINEYRRLKRLPELVTYDEQISAYQMTPRDTRDDNDLRDQIENRMFGDEISVAIASLPEKFKSVVVLRDIEDMPYEEIAEALQIPVGTVRSRLHRARALMFGKLKEYAKQHGYTVGDRFEPVELAMAV
jgi:RNA polymerase sigma factor (sigma-70 family)